MLGLESGALLDVDQWMNAVPVSHGMSARFPRIKPVTAPAELFVCPKAAEREAGVEPRNETSDASTDHAYRAFRARSAPIAKQNGIVNRCSRDKAQAGASPCTRSIEDSGPTVGRRIREMNLEWARDEDEQ